jgi:hypothetical protein
MTPDEMDALDDVVFVAMAELMQREAAEVRRAQRAAARR